MRISTIPLGTTIDLLRTPGEALTDLSLEPFNTHYEVANHGLLASRQLTCKYKVKRYAASSTAFMAQILERELLDIPAKPAVDLWMTVLFSFYRGRQNRHAGILTAQSAIAIFGATNQQETGSQATISHITYGTRMEDKSTEAVSMFGQLRYAHELILPKDALEAAHAKSWNCRIEPINPDDCEQLVDLVETTDSKYRAT